MFEVRVVYLNSFAYKTAVDHYYDSPKSSIESSTYYSLVGNFMSSLLNRVFSFSISREPKCQYIPFVNHYSYYESNNFEHALVNVPVPNPFNISWSLHSFLYKILNLPSNCKVTRNEKLSCIWFIALIRANVELDMNNSEKKGFEWWAKDKERELILALDVVRCKL